jgi:hypothetical protein
MVYNLTYSTSIFESLGVLSSFNISETIWEKYEKFAISKLKESTIKLRGSLYYLKDLTPNDASKELNSFSPLIPVLSKLRAVIEPIDDRKFREFRIAALDFFDTVDFLYFNLQDIADIHSSYELSKPVLATDWDSNEDEHWNNY